MKCLILTRNMKTGINDGKQDWGFDDSTWDKVCRIYDSDKCPVIEIELCTADLTSGVFDSITVKHHAYRLPSRVKGMPGSTINERFESVCEETWREDCMDAHPITMKILEQFFADVPLDTFITKDITDPAE